MEGFSLLQYSVRMGAAVRVKNMKLTKIRIREFKSIQDSTEVKIGDITCLVGKNESGKTALLQALYRLNPFIEEHGNFDVTDDYPRLAVGDYKNEVAAGRREPAQVVQATYALEANDINAVEEIFGSQCLKDENPAVTLHKGYSKEVEFSGLNVDDKAALAHLVKVAGLPQPLTEELLEQETAEAMVDALSDAEQTEAVQQLQPMLQKISESDAGVENVAYDDILDDRIPKFLYFDEYYQMKGQDSLEALRQRVESGNLEGPDYPLLGLIDLAGLNLDQIAAPERTEALLANLEAAENQLTQKVLSYWSQNLHLRMKFDIRPGQPRDPAGMTDGINIWGRVHDTKHMVSTALGTRSRGFVWFFSFLAWYSQLRKKSENLILLLDEPGLSLHAKAQADLLRYFEEELKPHHQLIYTTHSPFMVDPRHFERVRIVQNLSIEPDSDNLPEDRQGTQVITEVLDATPDSLFPLQGALGYEITQTLFIGPNCLLVEGPSDLRYIQTVSALLQERGKAGLSADWTIIQVGGSGRISAFVALLGAQKDLKVALLIDYQKNDRQSIERLYKMKLLETKGIFTYAQFIDAPEADVEDMFDPKFYLKLVNREFGSSVGLDDLPKEHNRILLRIKYYLENNPLPEDVSFNHYRPARYFSDNIDSLADELSEPELDRFQQAFTALNNLL